MRITDTVKRAVNVAPLEFEQQRCGRAFSGCRIRVDRLLAFTNGYRNLP